MKLVAPPTASPPLRRGSAALAWPCSVLLGAGCSGLAPPDPYLGTVDSTAFDATFGGGTGPRCLAPRRGYGGATGLDPVSWFYVGALSPTQVDVLNLSDPARTPPIGVYSINGCSPVQTEFDPRTDNFVRTEQYPVLPNNEPEPTALTSYKPWHVVVPIASRPERDPRFACNDIKSQTSIETRSGWDRDNKVFGRGDFDPQKLVNWPYGFVTPEGEWTEGLDLKPVPPTADQVRAGMVTVKDWPMVGVASPVLKTSNMLASCPLMDGNTARYPRYPGDPAADFQFPQGAWVRGLLSGYLDGGDVPLNTNPLKCPALIATSKTCAATSDCDAPSGQVCSSSTPRRCLSRLAVCPVFNDLFVPTTEIDRLATGTVDLMDMNGKRTAEIISVFSASPGQPGFSPVCRLLAYDPTKVTCARKEAEVISPRPLCTAAEINASPGAIVARAESYVNCLFLAAKKS